jgi:hypothetical protein
MRVATLIAWLLTVSLGGYMLLTWLTRDGLRRERERRSGLPPLLIFGHAGLALTGLVLWIVFLVSGARVLAWSAVGSVTLAIAMGLSTVTVWTPFPARREYREDAFAEVEFGESRFEEPGYRITDEMIARLLDEPATVAGAGKRRKSELLPHLAAIVPIAHGLLAMVTLVLAVTVASAR